MGYALFRVGRIPVRVHASWLAIVGLIAWSLAVGYFPRVLPDVPVLAHWVRGLVAALLLFVSVFLHELAHSVVARAYGLPVSGITLHVFGGVSQLEREPDRPGVEVLMAVVGPLTSFALAFALMALGVFRALSGEFRGRIAGRGGAARAHPGALGEREEARRTSAGRPGEIDRRGGVRVSTRLVAGSPAPDIVDVARRVNADLVVLGTHGRTGVRRLVLGSVAERVVRTARRAVLTVGPALLIVSSPSARSLPRRKSG